MFKIVLNCNNFAVFLSLLLFFKYIYIFPIVIEVLSLI